MAARNRVFLAVSRDFQRGLDQHSAHLALV
jgi:hypothetical protein